MKLLYPLLIILCWSIPCFAEDIKTLTGQTYQDAIITRQDPASITITHKNGVSRILFQELPSDLQKKYGYDPEAEQKYLDKLKSLKPVPPVTVKDESSNPGVPDSKVQSVSKKDGTVQNEFGDRPTGATTPTGKTIYEGPRGGHYHISKNGNKVYEKRK